MAPLVSFGVVLLGALVLAVSAHRTSIRFRRVGYLGVVLGLLFTAWITDSMVLGKGIGRLAMPVGLVWMVGYAAVWWSAHAGSRRQTLGLFALWLAYSLAGNDLVGKTLLRSLEAEFVSDAAAHSQAKLDALFVLAGGTGRRFDGVVQLGSAGDRLVTAARMYHAGTTPRLVYASPHGARDQTLEALEIWSLLGIPADAVHRIRGPHNTSTEVAAFEALARERGWKRPGLMTSAWHLRRAMAHAARAQWAVAPFPSDVRGTSWRPSFMGIVPSGAGFYRVHLAMWEYLGAAVGR